MNWTDVLEFARGPLFYACLLIFVAGMFYRLMRILMLGWGKDRIKDRVESVSKTCPRCRGSGSLLSEFDRRKVTILTMQFCHVISIPLIECARYEIKLKINMI